MPLDKGAGKSFAPNADRQNKTVGLISDSDVIMDDGIKTTKRNLSEIANASTIIWNGTFGMAEWGERWGYSTYSMARAIAEQTQNKGAVSVVGGGDTVAALDAIGVRDCISYVSTGGGAFLEFIEKRELPAISVLKI